MTQVANLLNSIRRYLMARRARKYNWWRHHRLRSVQSLSYLPFGSFLIRTIFIVGITQETLTGQNRENILVLVLQHRHTMDFCILRRSETRRTLSNYESRCLQWTLDDALSDRHVPRIIAPPRSWSGAQSVRSIYVPPRSRDTRPPRTATL